MDVGMRPYNLMPPRTGGDYRAQSGGKDASTCGQLLYPGGALKWFFLETLKHVLFKNNQNLLLRVPSLPLPTSSPLWGPEKGNARTFLRRPFLGPRGRLRY